MTIAAAVPTWVQIPGNSSATVFAFPFKIFQATDLVVGFITATGYAQQTSGFAVPISSIDVNGGGSIIFTTPPPTGTTVDIRTQTPMIQNTEFANLGAFLPESHTEAFDRLTRTVQDLYRLAYTFGIHGPDQENMAWTALPVASQRKNNALMFDSNGLPTIGTLVAQALTQSLIGQFLYPQTAAEIAAGVTPTNYYFPSHLAEGHVHLQRYGGDASGVTSSSAAFASAAAVAAQIDAPIMIPEANAGASWLMTQPWTLTGSKGCRVVGIGKPSITFSGIGSSTDVMTFGGASNQPQVEIRNLNINANLTGRDGLVILGSNRPIVSNVQISNVVRDWFVLSPSGTNFIEKGQFDLTGQTIGRHGLVLNLSGSGGAYINECVFDQLEVRGYSSVTAGAHAVYGTATATSGGSTFSNLQFRKTNFDCQYGVPYQATNVPGSDVVLFDSGLVQGITFGTGGWENTGTGVVPSGYGVNYTGTGLRATGAANSMVRPEVKNIVFSGMGGLGPINGAQPYQSVNGAPAGGQWVEDYSNGLTTLAPLVGTSTTPQLIRNLALWQAASYTGEGFKKLMAKYALNQSGTATSGSTTTLVDTTQTWAVNQWAGAAVIDLTTNLFATCLSNTSNTITFTAAIGTAVAAGHTYSLVALPASDSDGVPADGILHATVNIATSSSGNMIFPNAIKTNASADFCHAFRLQLVSSQFAGAGTVIQRDSSILVRPNITAVVEANVNDASSANELVSVTPSIVNTNQLQLAIVTGTAHAAGGGNQAIFGTLYRGAFF